MTWEELAVVLEVAQRTLMRWKNMPGAPTEPEEAAWREWMGENNRGPKRTFKLPSGVELPGECSYDDAAVKGFPYSEAIKRGQVIEQEIAIQKMQLALEKERGNLYTADQVAERAKYYNNTMQAQAELVFRMLDGIEGVSPAVRSEFLTRARAWRTGLGEAMRKAAIS